MFRQAAQCCQERLGERILHLERGFFPSGSLTVLYKLPRSSTSLLTSERA